VANAVVANHARENVEVAYLPANRDDFFMSDPAPNSKEWTVVRCGLAGMLVLGVLCGINFVTAIPRFFREPWTWGELLAFPLQVLVLGFLTGVVHGIVLPLARFGRWGDAAIGATCANVYLLVCFALFETSALLHPRLNTALALSAIATIGGIAMGLIIGKDIRQSKLEDSTQHGKSSTPPS
jgi:hypothetical protein